MQLVITTICKCTPKSKKKNRKTPDFCHHFETKKNIFQEPLQFDKAKMLKKIRELKKSFKKCQESKKTFKEEVKILRKT